jgi:hypothetical protein
MECKESEAVQKKMKGMYVRAAASTAAAVDKLEMLLDRKRASLARALTAFGHSPRQHTRSISAALSCKN